MKEKRILNLFLFIVMIFSVTNISVFADNSTNTNNVESVTVDFTAQADGGFLCAPQINVSVSSNTAENYGFNDSVDGVSALDALVKLHEEMFGEYFTQDTASEFLAVNEYGYISTIFGEETTANGFIYNGGYPNDGTISQWGGYNGTTVTTQELSDGDTVDFFIYQDQTDFSDELAWFNYRGNAVTEITATPNSSLELGLNSLTYMMGHLYINADAIHEDGLAVSGAQIAWVDAETGALTDISFDKTDTNGNITLTVPESEGTYYLTAYAPDGALIMSLIKIIVSNVPQTALITMPYDTQICVSSPSGEYTIIAAAYSDGNLLNTKCIDVYFEPQVCSYKIAIPYEVGTSGANEIKVLFWDKLSDLKPMCSACRKTVSDK